MSSELFICLDVEKEPYIKKISNDKIINLTGESGSGKSYFTQKYIGDEYVIIDTDEVYSRFDKSVGINREFGDYLRNKYEKIPSLFEEFDTFYEEVLTYFKDSNKTVVIDSAQFRNMHNVSNLKGLLIVMRTSINTCYRRCISRYENNYSNASEEDKRKYAEKKKAIYKWYIELNNFLEKVHNI